VPVPSVYVPLSVAFPGVADDFGSFRSLVQSLSRTDTIFWCARLNLILSNPHNRDERGKQQYAVGQLFDAREIELLNRFMAAHPSARVLFREQLLELLRWTCLFSSDQPDDGKTFVDPDVRRRFAQAALMASDLWGGRVYRAGLPLSGDPLGDRRRNMPVLRAGVSARAPDATRVLVRGDAFYQGAFQEGYSEADAEFLKAVGLTMDEYMACLSHRWPRAAADAPSR
jgi:hypothetical protein